MASSRPSFQKRQKERARQEKQAEKAQRRAQRKQEQDSPDRAASAPQGSPQITFDEEGNPQALDFHDF